jgi:hypothetical protein
MSKVQVNKFEFTGKVVFVSLPIFYTDKMSKRSLVIEGWVNNKYRQEIPFDFVNDNMKLLDGIREDDWVTVEFSLRGRKNIQADGKARWFTSNDAFNCIKT